MTTTTQTATQQVRKSALPTTSAQGVSTQVKGRYSTAAPCVYTSAGRVYRKQPVRKSITLWDILTGKA